MFHTKMKNIFYIFALTVCQTHCDESETISREVCVNFSGILIIEKGNFSTVEKGTCLSKEKSKMYLRMPEDIEQKYDCPYIQSVDSEGSPKSSGECCYLVTINKNSEDKCLMHLPKPMMK